MKALATLIGTLGPATAFAAASAPTGEDGFFVWIFLGFFAMIVVGQLVPAFMLIIGIVRGLASKTKVETKAKER